MDIKAIATRLVELNLANKHMEIYEELYSEDVVSVENWGTREEHRGFEAIKQKGEQWYSMLEEMHELKVSEPLIADNSFAVTFHMDATFNEKGGPMMTGRMQFTELAIYRVNEDGKIYHEEFFG